MAYTSEAVSRNNNVDAMFSRLVGIQGGSGEHMWGAGRRHVVAGRNGCHLQY